MNPSPFRWIAHVDMDSFYVSVERLKNPKLKNLPVVVGGTGPRSVVASASYEARKFGVRSAMPTAQALRLCRSLVIVKPDFAAYSDISAKIFKKLESVAPVIEQVSVDEAYLDFTGCERLYSTRAESAEVIRRCVLEISGLTASVGVSTNKLVAKIASDMAKPDGILVVAPGGEAALLAPLQLKKIPGVGPKTSMLLELRGLKICKDLATKTDTWIHDNVGDFALELKNAALGLDLSPVTSDSERKSLGTEETFDTDIDSIAILRKLLKDMSEKLATSLREENLSCRTIQIKLRYADFSTWTRAKSVSRATFLSQDIFETAFQLLVLNKVPSLALRLLGLSVRNFASASEGKNCQLDLFENPLLRVKKEKLEYLKDSLKKKFGDGVIKSN